MGVDTGKKKSAEPACSRGSASEEKLQAPRGKKHSSPLTITVSGTGGPNSFGSWFLVCSESNVHPKAPSAFTLPFTFMVFGPGHGFGGPAATFGASLLQLPAGIWS